jgi:hypothetical protein
MLLLYMWLASADAIVTRNIFCSGCTQVREQPVRLELELLSTLVCPRDVAWSRVLLRDRVSGEMRLIGPGARFGGARVRLISAQFVVMETPSGEERLLLSPTPPSKPSAPSNRCDGDRCTLQYTDVERMVAHPEQLQARALPAPDGFVLRLGPSSPLRQLGLADGDRLRAVDGTPLSMDALVHLWPKLRQNRHFTLSVVRAGQPRTFEVAVE